MNIEENRLQTFNDWPADSMVSPIRIAKAGFFSLNQGLTVECFCCGLKISEWNYGDQVMARHRQQSPACAFVLDPSTSGNVPNISQLTTPTDNTTPLLQDTATIVSQEQGSISFQGMPQNDSVDSPQHSSSLLHESVRLQSFANWPVPHIVTPENLSRAGFYYLKQRDKTKCAFCNGIVVAWEQGDDPDVEHRRHFPECSFVQTVIRRRLEAENGTALALVNTDPPLSNLNIVSQNNLHELGVNAHTGPKKSKYATVESRLRTFTTWPDDLIQTPDALAQAGFYYEGSGDQVRCFHCDGGLRHWDPQDDPWTEHARWFPKCAYILLVKGHEFITACALDSEIAGHGVRNLSNAPRIAQQGSRKCIIPFQRREVTEREVQAELRTPPVLTALSIGLHVGRIKQAIREKLELTGISFMTADAVIEATLNIQRDEEDNTDTHISQEVTRILSDAIQQTLNSSEEVNRPNDGLRAEATVVVTDGTSDSAAQTVDKPFSLEEENRLLKEARLCKICMDVEVGIVFLPCGHLATCINCAPNLQDCPVCRSTIKATVRTFLS